MDQDLASIQEARDLARRAHAAFREYRHFSQEQVDAVCLAVVEAAKSQYEHLARLAVEESGFGRVESKIEKTRFAVERVWEDIRDLKTAGIVHRDEKRGCFHIAEPYGVIAAIIPITNPTSTALFKILIALKSRNTVVLSPHPRGVRCISECARIAAEAARGAGAPDGSVACIQNATLGGTGELMRHEDTALILATGGSGLVRAAYTSGKPAYGVGPGNAPAYVDRSCDVRHAVRCVVASQTFDNSTICASEQSLVLDAPVKDAVLAEFRQQKAHACSAEEIGLLEKIVMVGRGMNPAIVGQDPWRIAEMAGFSVPRETTVLLCEYEGVGYEYPLSIEKLSPILSVYTADGWRAGCKRCIEILRLGGLGHTLVIHARDEDVIMRFALEKPAFRILVNSPSSQGAVGYSTNLEPSMTLGCGAPGGNITSDNVTARHLINLKRVAFVRDDFFADEGLEAPLTKRFGNAMDSRKPPATAAPGSILAPVRPYLSRGFAGSPAPDSAPRVRTAHLVTPLERLGRRASAGVTGGAMGAAEIKALIERKSRNPGACEIRGCTVGDCGYCV